MKAVQINRPDNVELITVHEPDPEPDEILVRVMASGICGTDVHILHGSFTGDYPVIPGHEFSGVVVKTGSRTSRIRRGDHVAVEPNIACDNCTACLNNHQNFCENWKALGVTLPGGMGQFVCAPEKAAVPINGISFEKGAFLEPLSCVLHGIEQVEPVMGGRALILGAGPIGLLLIQVLGLKGTAHITVAELNPHRALTAESMGANEIITDTDKVKKDYYDLVIDATGVPSVMENTPEFAKKGGHILLFGVPPADKKISLDAFRMFQKGLRVAASFTSVRNSFQAQALLQSGQIRVRELISHVLPLKDFEKGIQLMTDKDVNSGKIIILPND